MKDQSSIDQELRCQPADWHALTATTAQNQSKQLHRHGWPGMQAPHHACLVSRQTVDSLKLGGLPLEEVQLGDVHGGLGKWRPIFVTTQVELEQSIMVDIMVRNRAKGSGGKSAPVRPWLFRMAQSGGGHLFSRRWH